MDDEIKKRLSRLHQNTPQDIRNEVSKFLGRGGRKVYEEFNKMPHLAGDYRISMMKVLREKFVEQLKDAVKTEREYCGRTGAIPMMQGQLFNEVINLVEKCKTLFDIEALARFVFDENEVPNFHQVQTRARLLENAFAFTVKH